LPGERDARLSTLVAEDEPLARRRLVRLIGEVPWAVNVGEAADGAEAVRSIEALRPDAVFLDIRMPELSGLAVVERLTYTPAVAFTTAYDRYAVTAFELEAVDYLLKPFGRDRVVAALERARRVVEARGGAAALERARAALAAPAPPGPLARLLVRDRSGIVPLAPPEIERLEAQDDYVMVHAGGRGYLVGLPLGELEARLPSPPFLRVHRSHVVNLDHVERIVPHDDGVRLEVRMRDGTRLLASRARSQEIRRMSR
jgi:two-component system, LytTR family, response regulator